MAGLYASCINAGYGGKAGLETAKKQLDTTITRLRKIRKQLPEGYKQTLISALNNRAVIALRQRDADRAVKYWSEAVELSTEVPFVVYHNATILLEVSGQPGSLLRLEARSRRDLLSLLASTKPEGPGTQIPHRFMYSTLHDSFLGSASEPAKESAPDAAKETTPIEPGWQLFSTGSGFLIAPDLALTNRHVVEGHDKGLRFRVRNEEGVSSLVSVTKVSTRESVDLALLKLERAVAATPLPLRSESARIGERMAVLGYPDPSVFESTLAVSEGAVNKQIDNGLNILHDATTNPGSSGGPCLDFAGNVIGIHYSGSAVKGGIRRWAVSSPSALDFLGGVANYRPQAAENGELKLPDLVEKVKPAVFQVECWASADLIRQLLAASVETSTEDGPEVALRAYELWPELTCFLCNGSGFQDCPKCIAGKISVKRRVQVSINQVNGSPIYGTRVFKDICDLCRGRSGAACTACRSGRLPFDD